MPKVIETNVSFDDDDNTWKAMKDNQSRVIEVKDWKEYVEELQVQAPIQRDDIVGNLNGLSIPVSYLCNKLYENERSIGFVCHVPNTNIWTYKFSYLAEE